MLHLLHVNIKVRGHRLFTSFISHIWRFGVPGGKSNGISLTKGSNCVPLSGFKAMITLKGSYDLDHTLHMLLVARLALVLILLPTYEISNDYCDE